MDRPRGKQLEAPDKWLEIADLTNFTKDLESLGKELQDSQGEADLVHFQKVLFWNRLFLTIGLLTLGFFPNPLTILCLSLATFSRWTMIGHHVSHGGYDRVDPSGRYHRVHFAMGSLYRRVSDWLDWMLPEAWNLEHNKCHHYSLNEEEDPDLVEANLESLRNSRTPMFIKYITVFFFMATWKWFYYSPNTFSRLQLDQKIKKGEQVEVPLNERNFITLWASLISPPSWLSRTEMIWKVLGPYFVYQFLVIPLPLLVLFGEEAFKFGVINLILSEVLTNIHSFVVVVTNHAGDDLYCFDTHCKPKKEEFFLRQVIGSVNYRTGGDVNDFLHGFLNYQIEHHLWPNLSMLSYQKAQPRVKKICKKYNVPYVQQSVWRRLMKTIDIMVGKTSMRRFPRP